MIPGKNITCVYIPALVRKRMRDYFGQAKSLVRPSLWIISAYVRAALSGWAMPPGGLIDLRKKEFRDRRYLYKRGQLSNNIFKALQSRRLIICLTDLDSSRRLLSTQADNLRADSIVLTMLFPKGLLRNLEGLDHKYYRHSLVKALDLSTDQQDEECSRIINHWLQQHASSFPNNASTPEELTTTLSKISTALLIQMYFGVRFGTRDFDALMTLFYNLGPDGLIWTIDVNQRKSFEKICLFLRSRQTFARPCVMQGVVEDDGLDDVALGNLIYMVEMGRYDLHSLFRWLLKYASENPEIMQQISKEESGTTQRSMGLAQAFVLETLRLDQSERLIRVVQNDFVFDGYFFPKHAYVRLCLWEAHKSEENFPEAFAFNPQRFIENNYGIDVFAPFGLDKHRCPMANPVIQLGALLVRNLAKDYKVKAMTQSSENRGLFHWQPGADFSVGIYERCSRE